MRKWQQKQAGLTRGIVFSCHEVGTEVCDGMVILSTAVIILSMGQIFFLLERPIRDISVFPVSVEPRHFGTHIDAGCRLRNTTILLHSRCDEQPLYQTLAGKFGDHY